MTDWLENELRRIAETDDLHIAPFREDGRAYGTPTWIWSVVVNGDLYVRPYHGQSSRWYRAAMRQKGGRITAAGMTKEVAFEPVQGPINERIDDAYRGEVRGEPLSRPHDRSPHALGDGPSDPALLDGSHQQREAPARPCRGG